MQQNTWTVGRCLCFDTACAAPPPALTATIGAGGGHLQGGGQPPQRRREALGPGACTWHGGQQGCGAAAEGSRHQQPLLKPLCLSSLQKAESWHVHVILRECKPAFLADFRGQPMLPVWVTTAAGVLLRQMPLSDNHAWSGAWLIVGYALPAMPMKAAVLINPKHPTIHAHAMIVHDPKRTMLTLRIHKMTQVGSV